MKYELREMVRTGQGSIVNTASVAGLMPEASQGAYVAAKHGVIGLTKTAAFENAHLGIRVNALAPGWVRTPLTAGLEDATGVIQRMKERNRCIVPLGLRKWWPWCCFSALTQPRITGQAFVVDGGQSIRGLVPVETTLPSTHGAAAAKA